MTTFKNVFSLSFAIQKHGRLPSNDKNSNKQFYSSQRSQSYMKISDNKNALQLFCTEVVTIVMSGTVINYWSDYQSETGGIAILC